MDLGFLLHALIPSWNSVAVLVIFFPYSAVAGSILPGKLVPGVNLQDGSRLHYRCNGLLALLLLVRLLGVGSRMNFVSPTVISDRGLELLSATFIFSIFVMLVLNASGRQSSSKGSSLKPHITGNLINDWWYGIQLNPQFMGIDLKFFFVRAGMMGWLLINLSILAKSVQDGSLSQSMTLYQLFSVLEFPDLLLIQLLKAGIPGWWLLNNKVELTTGAAIANCFVFLIGYLVFRGANKQKHIFKKNPKALIWGKPPKVIGGKLLASGYWGIARHSNYLGDLLLALSFSLPCGISSPIPYLYPIYLFVLLIWRERRDEARCTIKYKEIWAEYCRFVPWRIFPYLY
ncbi:hypothetical protein PTKIN_Ptkin13bG0253400 [Pterospermum kingtungense]